MLHDETPTVQDIHGDAHVRTSPMPDELDAAFGYGTSADALTDAELDALYIAEMERRNQPPVIHAPFPDDWQPLPQLRPITQRCRRIDVSQYNLAK